MPTKTKSKSKNLSKSSLKSISKGPSKALLQKYKDCLIKANLKEFGLDNKDEAMKYLTPERYKTEVDGAKKQVNDLKYDNRGLVFYISKNFPKDKFYQDLREKQRFTIFKMFGY